MRMTKSASLVCITSDIADYNQPMHDRCTADIRLMYGRCVQSMHGRCTTDVFRHPYDGSAEIR